MKIAGILGGLGPQSTELFYQELIRLFQTKRKGMCPRLIINSVDLWEFAGTLNDRQAAISFALREIKKIEDQVDFIAIPCNSFHFILDEIRDKVSKPIIAIQEVVAKEIKRSNCKSVAILGTSTTAKSGFYQRELMKHNIKAIIPKEEDIKKISNLIFSKVLHGLGFQEMNHLLQEQITRLDCEGVILACTELPLCLRQEETDVKLFSSTQILAKAVFEEIIS